MLILLLDRQTHFGWDGNYLDNEEQARWSANKRAIKRKLIELKSPYSYNDMGEWMNSCRSRPDVSVWMKENGKK